MSEIVKTADVSEIVNKRAWRREGKLEAVNWSVFRAHVALIYAKIYVSINTAIKTHRLAVIIKVM